MSRKISKLEQFVKLFGLIFIVLGVMTMYFTYTSPELSNSEGTLFNGIGLALIIIGLTIAIVKVKK